MRALHTHEPYQWIRTHLDNQRALRDPLQRGNLVANCFPMDFAALCKLLHPLYARLPDPSIPPGFASVPRRGARVRWQQLAANLGRSVGPETSFYSFTPWPRAVVDPDEGTLDDTSVDQLAQRLALFTGTQPCYFFYDLIATPSHEHDLLFVGQLDEARTTFMRDDVFGSPTYWWPRDRTWCVHTNWDLTFTLVGGSQALITLLVTDAKLECIRVLPQTRVDYQADT